jgi:hypothetical protein
MNMEDRNKLFVETFRTSGITGFVLLYKVPGSPSISSITGGMTDIECVGASEYAKRCAMDRMMASSRAIAIPEIKNDSN